MNDDTSDLEALDVTAEASQSSGPSPGSEEESWPAGWYADAWTAGQYRYWSGRHWTGETRRWGPTPAAPGDPEAADADAGVTRAWPSWSSSAPTEAASAPPTTAVPPSPPEREWPDGPAPRPRGRMIAGVIALVVLMIVSGVVGYIIDSHNSDSNGSRSNRSATPAPTPTTVSPGGGASTSTDPDRRVLGGLVVRQRDVGSANPVLLEDGGNGTTKPTLDLCNGRFASERLRTARLQVAEVDPNGALVFSTEAVLYRSPAATAQAFRELRSVAASCPHTPVSSPVGEPTATTTFRPAPDRGWPQTPTVTRLAYSFVSSDGQSSIPSIAVYLHRGRAFLGLYFNKPSGPQPAVGGKTSIEAIVGLFAARLAALPASVVGASR